MRTDQHNVTQQTDLTHEDDMVEGGDAPQQAEQQEEVGEHGAHTPQQVQTPTIASDAAVQHLETFLASAAVNDGHEGRVLRGAGKQGGYTLGPALRTLHVKNLGTDLAPERLRTCPWLGVHHRCRSQHGRGTALIGDAERGGQPCNSAEERRHRATSCHSGNGTTEMYRKCTGNVHVTHLTDPYPCKP